MTVRATVNKSVIVVVESVLTYYALPILVERTTRLMMGTRVPSPAGGPPGPRSRRRHLLDHGAPTRT